MGLTVYTRVNNVRDVLLEVIAEPDQQVHLVVLLGHISRILVYLIPLVVFNVTPDMHVLRMACL